MALVALDGQWCVPIGMGFAITQNAPSATSLTMDAANENIIFIGRIQTSDGGSHTIDTTGSSSIGWRTGAVTFASGTTIVKVGLAAVDTANGPPGRAVNVSDVITFDVSRSITGGGGGITANAWQVHVPTAGTKTVANGDLVVMAVQMTVRGGSDSVIGVASAASSGWQRPNVTQFASAAYSFFSAVPNTVITFADGATGFFQGCDVFSTQNVLTWNSTGGTKEYGQLFSLPFPVKVYGAWGWIDPDADCDIVLYSSPLATPVAQKTVSIDSNTISSTNPRRFVEMFPSPYSAEAGETIVVAFKPDVGFVSANSKTIANAAHRITDPWGLNGYGVSRATAAFSDLNSSLDHLYIGLIVGAFDAGGGGGRAIQVNNDSLVA